MMRLRRLDLTRFGHFTDCSVDLGPAQPGKSDFHIIYGPNEAGKTTLMEGYLRLIYGFPMRDGYGFKHPLNTLQVGGLVEIKGVSTELVRLKKTTNSLQDKHGDAIPESILQGCLGGIAQDDYRKLFCLDDATIEAGGDEITNSKGDIGRLLFAAAAGIGDLTGVLDLVATRAEGFYKKSASKTIFAGLKRDLDALTTEIKTIDVSASLYHNLRTAVEAAKSAEVAARAAEDDHERRKAQLAAVIVAHPIATALHTAEEAHAPISHFPLSLDIDPETLVELMTARIALQTNRDRQSEVIVQAESDREALIQQPAILALRGDILALDDMRGRMEGAQADLPIRITEREAAIADMGAKLVDIGLDPGDDPTSFVLPEPVLLRLERCLQTLRDAENKLTAAKNEFRNAQDLLRETARLTTEAEAGVTIGPEVDDVLMRFDATRCVEDNRAALQRVALARTSAAKQLRGLGRGAVIFSTLPTSPLTIRQAEVLAAASLKADQTLESLCSALSLAAEKVATTQARVGVLTETADLVTDEIATTRRAERNARWTDHRATLDETTADSFAAAMQTDDVATALRQAQTQEIAEFDQARIAAGEAKAEQLAAKDRLNLAIEAHNGLVTTCNDRLSALALPLDLSASDLADWVRQHIDASAALDELRTAQDASAQVIGNAEALQQALSALPGMPVDGDVDTLFRLAAAQSQKRKSQLAALHINQSARAKDSATVFSRQSAMDTAQGTFDAAQNLWQTGAAAALPVGTPLENLHDALPNLRSLREINEAVGGLSRQISGMTRDRDNFVTRATPLGVLLGVAANSAALDICRQARQSLTDADEAARKSAELTVILSETQALHATAVSELATQDAQIRQLAEAFAPNIPTETLHDLRSAVAQGKSAIDLRATIAKDSAALIARLGVTTREAAEAVLATQPLQDAEAALASLYGETDRLSRAIETAIEARTKAQAALDHVQGDADVAKRVALQRTIEIEMQEGSLRYLEDRFAHLLAERALRRYRDTHRGGMLVATETAFRTLTNGAYASLTTQAEGQSEALVAIQSVGGSSKKAREMSKGTKFQLYLALRAAAYEQVATGGTILPFFCDDIFETFDESRTTAACGLLRQIGQTGQSIYLTHHKHVVALAERHLLDAEELHRVFDRRQRQVALPDRHWVGFDALVADVQITQTTTCIDERPEVSGLLHARYAGQFLGQVVGETTAVIFRVQQTVGVVEDVVLGDCLAWIGRDEVGEASVGDAVAGAIAGRVLLDHREQVVFGVGVSAFVEREGEALTPM